MVSSILILEEFGLDPTPKFVTENFYFFIGDEGNHSRLTHLGLAELPSVQNTLP